MNYDVVVQSVKTIHTNTEDSARADQPVIEFTLLAHKAGSTKKYTVKFTEMLSTLAPLTNAELLEHLTETVQAYVETTYGKAGSVESALDPTTKDWIKTAAIVGKTYTITV